MKRVAIFALWLSAVGASFVAGATPRVFPKTEWEVATPASQGLDSDKLDEAFAYLASVCGPRKTAHTLLIRHGYLVWQGKDLDTVFDVWSCTKSFAGTAMGLLIEDRRCTLESRACEFVPSLKTDYPDVTLRHFATLTAGMQSVKETEPFSPAAPLFAPGTRFHYGDDMNMMGLVLTRIAGEPLRDLFKRRIADPIGLNPAQWSWGDWGVVDGIVVNGGSGTYEKGIRISARQMARMGYLLLNQGNWNGRQLINREWLAQATSPQVSPNLPPHDRRAWYNEILGAYGYNFWVNGVRPDGRRLWPEAPASTFVIQGNNNNHCFIIPEWDIVVVRLGNDKVISAQLYNEFFAKLKQAGAEGIEERSR